jgi:hypothetical protein
MKAVRITRVDNDVFYITNASLVQTSMTDRKCITVKAIDESNHVVGKPMTMRFSFPIASVFETEYPYEND